MQIVRREQTPIQPLVCGGCQHWHAATTGIDANGERIGRCARFHEPRIADMRPRCNICWEPREAGQNYQSPEVDVQ